MLHLDNVYSARLMVDLIGDRTKEVVLAHLSEEANSEAKALETYKNIFNENNIIFNKIKVANQVNIVSGGKREG